jgi:hypothetical protein
LVNIVQNKHEAIFENLTDSFILELAEFVSNNAQPKLKMFLVQNKTIFKKHRYNKVSDLKITWVDRFKKAISLFKFNEIEKDQLLLCENSIFEDMFKQNQVK